MNFNHTDFIRLTNKHVILPFSCGDSDADKDLNNFLLNDSKGYSSSLLAITYILESRELTSAFFCVSNDNIAIEKLESKTQFVKRFKNRMPKNKRFNSYPAVKIGRLAIHKEFQNTGFGTSLIDFIKGWFITNNRTGCMYLLVDAYKQSIPFYHKNDFVFLSEKDKDSNTRVMYYDLTQLL